MDEVYDEVTGFIWEFLRRTRYKQEVLDSFLYGNCYWFAHILQKRFEKYKPVIMYDMVQNHFATQIGDRVYDISGDVTSEFWDGVRAIKYFWIVWDEYDGGSHRDRITRECINFGR